MELRAYQDESVEAVYRFLRERAGNPCLVLPTGAGKSLILGKLCADAVTKWDGRVLILAHVKELLEQNADKVRRLCPGVRVGVYSAGLNRREADAPVVVAGIQSVFDKADRLGRFDLVLVDEAHLLNPSGEGRYQSLLSDLVEINPDLRVVGLTATPFRLGSGLICGPENLLTEVCHEVGVKELIAQKYLSPLVGVAAAGEVDTSAVKVVRGEMDDAQAEAAFTAAGVVQAAVAEVLDRTAARRAVLVFCQTVAHAKTVAAELRSAARLKWAAEQCLKPAEAAGFDPAARLVGDWRAAIAADWLEEQGLPVAPLRAWLAAGHHSVGEVYGDTPADGRAHLVDEFRAGRLKYLVNVGCYTTGFDAPNVDCVVLLRATASPGLYAQMVGRGLRLADGKEDCLILDFGQNIERHGPIDAVKPSHKAANVPAGKVCPECRVVAGARAAVCLACGHLFPPPEAGPPGDAAMPHGSRASDADPVSGKPKTETHPVMTVSYRVHTKKGADESAPKTLRVTYQTSFKDWVSEWVCVEHEGFALDKARKWWGKRCRFPMPRTAVEAVTVAEHGLLAKPLAVTLKTMPGKPFPEVTGCDLGALPRHPDPCERCGAVNERVLVASPDPRHVARIVCGGCGHHHGPASAAQLDHYGLINSPGRTHFGGMLPAAWKFDPVETAREPGDDAGGEADELAPAAAGDYADDDCPF